MVLLVAYNRACALCRNAYKGEKCHYSLAMLNWFLTSMATGKPALIDMKRRRVLEQHQLIDRGTGLPILFFGRNFKPFSECNINNYFGRICNIPIKYENCCLLVHPQFIFFTGLCTRYIIRATNTETESKVAEG